MDSVSEGFSCSLETSIESATQVSREALPSRRMVWQNVCPLDLAIVLPGNHIRECDLNVWMFAA
jgi:hypothetical protein